MRNSRRMVIEKSRVLVSLITNQLLLLPITLLFVSCIEDPPSLNRDPDELESDLFNQTNDSPEDQGYSTDLSPDQEVDQATTEEIAGEMLAGEMFAGEMLAGEMLAGEMFAGEMLAGEMLAGEMLAGEMLAGEMLAGEIAGTQTWPPLNLPEPIPSQEVCDGIDNDLDALVDETVSNPCGGCSPWDPELGCIGWNAQLIETQLFDDDQLPVAGSLPSDRLIALSSAVQSFETFDIDGAQCRRYRSPQAWFVADSMGTIDLDTPLVSLTLTPDPQRLGRYRTLGEDGMFIVHEPTQQIDLSWTGEEQDRPSALTINAGQFSLQSPAYVELASADELERVLDVVQRPVEHPPEEIVLRWVPQPDGDQAGLPMTFYIGGSVSLFQRGAYRSIRHYQLVGTLFDDGRMDLPFPEEFRSPGSSTWVYLERVRRAQDVSGINPVSAQAGHRIEARGRSGEIGDSPQSFATLLTPSPEDPEPDITSNGLALTWSILDPAKPLNQLTISLILYDQFMSEQLTCILDNPMSEQLFIPAERLTFWPRSQNSVRQVTLRGDLERLELPFPDRGSLRKSESLILRLSDL